MTIDQNLINIVFAIVSGSLGWIVKVAWDAQKNRDDFEREILQKVQAIELLIAGDYVKKDEFRELSRAIFAKLDQIENKIDRKADKP